MGSVNIVTCEFRTILGIFSHGICADNPSGAKHDYNRLQLFYCDINKTYFQCKIRLITVTCDVASNITDLNHFHSLEAVDRVSEPQLQVSENLK